jgi:hypothetical protein
VAPHVVFFYVAPHIVFRFCVAPHLLFCFARRHSLYSVTCDDTHSILLLCGATRSILFSAAPQTVFVPVWRHILYSAIVWPNRPHSSATGRRFKQGYQSQIVRRPRRLRWSSGSQAGLWFPSRGFKPGRRRWIFLYIKILSMPSFGGEVK